MTTVVSATIEPTDRSMPPATITIVMPSAAMQTIAVCRAISSRLPGAKKLRARRGRRRSIGHQHEAEHGTAGARQRPRQSCRALGPRCREHHPSARSDSAAGRARLQPAAAHDRDAIAEAEQLGQVAADQTGPRSAVASIGLRRRRPARRSSAVDLRLAADVDAARRLVEQQDVDVVMQQPRERDLLLVAAGELADRLRGPRALDPQPLDPRGAPTRCCRAARQRAGRSRSSRVSVRLSAMLRPSARPSLLRSSLSMPTPCAPAIACRRGAAAVDADADRGRCLTGSRPKSARSSSRAPGADQPGDAEDLAAVQREASAAPGSERRRPRAIGLARSARGVRGNSSSDAAADHQSRRSRRWSTSRRRAAAGDCGRRAAR